MSLRAEAIVKTIARAAAANLPCPTNEELGRRVGAHGSSIANDMAKLIKAGVLHSERIERDRRIVTIVATGKRTAA